MVHAHELGTMSNEQSSMTLDTTLEVGVVGVTLVSNS